VVGLAEPGAQHRPEAEVLGADQADLDVGAALVVEPEQHRAPLGGPAGGGDRGADARIQHVGDALGEPPQAAADVADDLVEAGRRPAGDAAGFGPGGERGPPWLRDLLGWREPGRFIARCVTGSVAH
jgi:hypothetical protein